MNRNPRSTASFRLTIGPGQRLLRAAGAPGPRIDGAQTVGWQIAGQQVHALAGAAAGHRGADSLVFTHGGLVFLSSLAARDRKSTRLNSSHLGISYAVF